MSEQENGLSLSQGERCTSNRVETSRMLGGIAASGLVGVEVLPSTSESSSGLEIDVVDFEGPDPANPDGPPITWRQTRVFTGSRTTFPKMPEITQ